MWGFCRAATLLHEALLGNVLRTGMGFFDVTPVGRLLSRFSGDLDAIDEDLPEEMLELLLCFIEVRIFPYFLLCDF